MIPFSVSIFPDGLGGRLEYFWNKILTGLCFGGSAFIIAVAVPGDRLAAALILTGILLASWFGGVVAGVASTGLGLLSLLLFFDMSTPGAEMETIFAFLALALLINGFNLWRRQVEHKLVETRAQAEEASTRLAKLSAASTDLLRARTREEVAEVTIRSTADALDAKMGALYLHRPRTSQFELIGFAGYDDAVNEGWRTFPDDIRTPVADAFRERRIVSYPSTAALSEEYPELVEVYESHKSLEIEARAYIPLTIDDRCHGILVFSTATPRQFSEADLRLIEAFANQAALAIDRVRIDEAEVAARHLAEAHEEQLQVALEATRRSKREVELITNSVPALISYIDREKRYVFNNRGYEEWFGSPAEAIRGLHVEEVIGAEAYAQVLPRLEVALTGQRVEFEEQVPYQTGSRWVHVTYAPDVDEFGEVLGIYTLVIDVSHNKQLENEREMLAELSEHLVEPLNLAGIVEKLGAALVPAFADVMNVTFLTNGSVDSFMIRPDAEPVRQTTNYLTDGEDDYGLAAVLKTGEPEFYVNLPPDLRRNDPLAVLPDPHSLIAVPIKGQDRVIGAITSYSAGQRAYSRHDLNFLMEVSRRASVAIENIRIFNATQRHAEDLERANKAKDEFLGLVSHELRTPLTTIVGNADVLRRNPNMRRELRIEAISDISNESERLGRIVENMLHLARLELGHQPELEPVLLARLLRHMSDDFYRQIPQAHLQLFGPPEDEIVIGREEYIIQILQNLLSNAYKYGNAQEPITLSAEREEDFAVVSVGDRGKGIPAIEAARIFEPLYREPSEGHVAGLGIGLAVCKRLVEAQGGQIDCTQNPGGGSRFSFTIPIWTEVSRG